MRKIILLLATFLIACGGEDFPVPIDIEEENPINILNTKTCSYGHLYFNDIIPAGVIDSSFDTNSYLPGIQTNLKFEYYLGVLPSFVRMTIVQNRKMLYTTGASKVYTSQLDLPVGTPTLHIKIYTYGWCEETPTFFYKVVE